MYAERHTVSLTTDGSGNAVGYTPNVTGCVLSVSYAKTDFADGVDFLVTAEANGDVIWDQDNVNASAVVYPRVPVHLTDGTAALYVEDGEPVVAPVVVVNDRIKVVVAGGGDTKAGTVSVVVG